MAFIHSPKIVTDGLIMYFDPANPKSYPRSGDVLKDISNVSSDATLINAPTFIPEANGVFQFNGTDEYIALSGESPFSGTKLVTAEYWVNFTSITGNFGGSQYGAFLFAGSTSQGAGQAELGILTADASSNSPSTIYYGRGGGGTTGTLVLDVSGKIINGRWNHIVLTRTSTSDQILYLNGNILGTGTVSNSFTDAPASIGSLPTLSTYSAYLNGKLGKLCVYNRALSAQEVLQNFNASRTRFGL